MVSWDEFISHLILGFNIKEATVVVESLEAPIQGAAVMLHSNHRHPVCKITLAPTVKKDRTYTYSDGNYLTASKDGVINYWSLDMQLERSVQSTSPEIKVRSGQQMIGLISMGVLRCKVLGCWMWSAFRT